MAHYATQAISTLPFSCHTTYLDVHFQLLEGLREAQGNRNRDNTQASVVGAYSKNVSNADRLTLDVRFLAASIR